MMKASVANRSSRGIHPRIAGLIVLYGALVLAAPLAGMNDEAAKMATYPSRTITVSIESDWRLVYDFTSIPQNFSRWAAGLGTRFEKSGDDWTAEDPNGRVIRIHFSPRNEFGVLDHTVAFEDGRIANNAMRVVPNGAGAEVMFTLLRLPGVTDEQFAADAAAVERDLKSLKTTLER
jgi:hypothetical protein